MNTSPWYVQHKNILRQVALTLLIISMVGTWVFDRINVPAQYPCHFPIIRLEGDFCGVPLSGFFVFYMLISNYFFILPGLVSGSYSMHVGELVAGLYLVSVFPFFTTLSFIWRKETRRFLTINLVAWILGLIPPFFVAIILLIEIGSRAIYLWGLWLYIITAIGAIAVEGVLLKREPNDG